MSDLILSSDWTLHGLRVCLLENRYLRVVILPEAGAKIWQITYKPLDAPLLWNNPRIAPSRQSIHARYDDVWSGGWDELFPNDEAGTVDGEFYPDHGELWTGAWHAEPFQTNESVGVRLSFRTPITACLVERTLELHRDNRQLHIRYRFTNQSTATLPFLWKLHPAFAVSSQHRIDFPPMTVVREPAFAGSLGNAPESFPWPHADLGDRIMDLRQVPGVCSQAVHFFYGTELKQGWCAVTDTKKRLAAGLRFDPNVFTSCWLFASYGGWRNLNVAVLEPATGYPFNLPAMIAAGRAPSLKSGESLATDALFTVQEKVCSVSGIDADGTILPTE